MLRDLISKFVYTYIYIYIYIVLPRPRMRPTSLGPRGEAFGKGTNGVST